MVAFEAYYLLWLLGLALLMAFIALVVSLVTCELLPSLALDDPLDPIADICSRVESNRTSSTLQFPSQRLTPADVTRVCTAMAKNSSVVQLSLRWSSMRTVLPLTQLLSSTSSLRSLDLSDTGLRTASFSSLVNSLAGNASLTSLSLNGNPVGDEGAELLAKLLRSATCQLASLDLGRTCITERGAGQIADALVTNSTLTSLNLEWNRVRSLRGFARALPKNRALRALHLGGGNVRGDIKAPLVAEILRSNSTLETLGLEWTGITDEGVKVLAQALPRNVSLTKLDLRGNEINADGVAALSDALMTNHTLRSLQVQVVNSAVPPALKALVRFLVVASVERSVPSSSALCALPTDILYSIATQFSFAETYCTYHQLATLARFIFADPSSVRAVLQAGEGLKLVELPQMGLVICHKACYAP